MTEQDGAKKQLIEQLEKVNMRLQILDMIENKLLKMKELAQRVVEEDLTENKIQFKSLKILRWIFFLFSRNMVIWMK